MQSSSIELFQPAESLPPASQPTDDGYVHTSEDGEPFAEDLANHVVIFSEVTTITEEV
ncbi:hypothetical protein PPTG_22612 [Phytophthora nicotianae INRA-310]|uniref:Uncharacterized protein n=4 Tax=Phytophthora nicotianae TaxID=4792 RepID=W2QDJ9_PHYN3|nr:hypothetical protein PPTG_22612 [Phytophthora nicotianae INRA-310]ETI49171.1 hypothetical protein F443_06909 [Phytophthora nicotianae P1569]ETN10946.1 hypothetical protein PPTG_22612 [Phytophthora nicotianae INRA-310]ETO77904.1 hypothetical protein F444_06978 [Phytophthora nicotianae P1976]